jgi:hypothetical protein
MSENAAAKASDEVQPWKVYVGLASVIALFVFLYIYGSIHLDAERQSGARTARAVVIDKHFAPGQMGGGVTSEGGYVIGGTADRYIVAVRATDGATGTKQLDVTKDVYYRLNVGTAVNIIITRGDLGDEGKYKVEIDPASIPAQPPIPPKALDYPDRDDLSKVKGQVRK